MKIYNEIILKWNDKTNQYDTLYEDSYEHTGRVDYAAKQDLTDDGFNLKKPKAEFKEAYESGNSEKMLAANETILNSSVDLKSANEKINYFTFIIILLIIIHYNSKFAPFYFKLYFY